MINKEELIRNLEDCGYRVIPFDDFIGVELRSYTNGDLFAVQHTISLSFSYEELEKNPFNNPFIFIVNRMNHEIKLLMGGTHNDTDGDI